VGDDNGEVDKIAGERSSEKTDTTVHAFPEKSDQDENVKKPRKI